MVVGTTFLALLFIVGVVNGIPRGRSQPRMKMPKLRAPVEQVFDAAGNALPPLNTTYYFDQLIDHKNPSLGTFKQRYYHSWATYQDGEY